jgi:phosphatidate cytidylyltransferase
VATSSDAASAGPDAAPPTAAPPPGPGRAGRNLPAAIGVGVGLGALVLGTLYSPARWTFVVVIAVAAAIGTWEVVRALHSLGARPPAVPLVAGGVAMVVLAYRYGAEELFLGLALTAVACLVWRLGGPAAGLLRDVTSAIFTATYVPFLVGFAALMTVPGDGPRRITAFILTVVLSDVGGYVAGVFFGKHRMAPSISPKKSWEGFAGSVLACTVGGAIELTQLFGAHWWQGLLFGLAVVCSATLGDLGESMIKRDIGIKDMGHLLPGHGGLMDRLDSLLPTAPVAWLLLTAFVPLPS